MKKIVVVLIFLCGWLNLDAAVSFTVNKTAGCAVLGVTFIDNSTHPLPVVSRTWDYGDGDRFPGSDTSGHPYITPGFYSPKLIVCYNNGTCDSIRYNNLINVYAKPTINYGFTDSLGCAPHTVNFTNNILPGCGTVSRLIVVYDVAANLFRDSASNAVTGGNFTVTYPTVGSRDVYIYARNSCGCFNDTTMVAKIKTFKKPTANFTGIPLTTCDTVITPTFRNTSDTSSSNYNLSWTFGNGLGSSILRSPSFTFYKYQNPPFDVKMVINEKYNNNLLTCSDSITRSAYVNVRNTSIDFSAADTVVCAGGSINFNNSSSPFASANWRIFGPTTINSTVGSPSINFTVPGVYSVELIVTYAGNCKDTILRTNYITVNPSPKATFRVSDSVFCAAPRIVNFTNQSSGFTSSNWTFTNGLPATSNVTSPTNISFSATGAAKLVVTNGFGCKDSLTKSGYIQFLGVDANFSANKLNGCNNDTFRFTNTSVGLSSDTIVSYQWDFDDNGVIDLTTTSKTNPFAVYSASGCRKVALTIQTQSGCTDTNRVNICTGPKPVASYTVDDNTPCLKNKVTFTYTGTLPITRTTWYPTAPASFTGVQRDTPLANTFSYTYTNIGKFAPFVVAENNGCRDTSLLPTEIDTIRIGGPQSSFSYQVQCNISKTNVKFTNSSTLYNRSWWDFGVLTSTTDTSTLKDPVFTFPDSGCYQVRLITQNDTTTCIDTITQNVCVYKPVINFSSSAPISCVGVVMTFTNNSSIVSSNPANTKWNLFGSHVYSPLNFGGGILEGSPVNFSYTNNGKFSVCMKNIDPNGCADSLCKTDYINITNPVVKTKLNDTLFCPGETVVCTDSSYGLGKGIQFYRWDSNGVVASFTKNVNITFDHPGRHKITHLVIDSAGCSNSIDTFVTYALPVSSFSRNRDSICPGQTINYTNNDITNGYTYSWSFQDATPSTFVGNNPPPITYNSVGIKVARLIASAWYSSCPDTSYDTVTIYRPTAAFTQDFDFANCGPLLVQFTGTPIGTNIVNHYWNFNDVWTPPFGTNLLTKTPFHKFEKPGNYNVMYIVETVTGCRDTLIKPNAPLIIGPELYPSYKYKDSCKVANIDFVFETRNAKKIDVFPQGAPPRFIVRNDTNCGQGAKPNCFDTFNISYSSPGSYFIDVFVTDQANLCNIPYKFGPFKVLTPPTAKIAASDTFMCRYNTIQFADSSVYPNKYLSLQWTLDTVPTVTGTRNPMHYYANPGTFIVKLKVEDSTRCVDSVTRAVVINDKPIANFNPVDVCLSDSTPFQNTSVLKGTAAGYTSFWNFGDSLVTDDTSLLNNPKYRYNSAKTYMVTLNINDNNGCKDTIVKQVQVHTLPKADFDTVGFCAGVPTLFNNKSANGSNPFGNPYSTWDFNLGSGPYSTSQNPQNTYNTPGNKVIKLVVVDTKGCRDSVSKSLTIFASPTADFTASPLKSCFGEPVTFTDISIPAAGPITLWEWDFDGDGSIDMTGKFPPIHSYGTSGNWKPKLFITDTNGCKSNTQKSVVIVNKPEVDFIYDAKTCVDSVINFTNTSSNIGSISTWKWEMGDGKQAPFQDLIYKYDFPGPYTVCLYGTDSIGCQDTMCKNILIDAPANVVRLEPASDTTVCLGGTVIVRVTGAQTFKWKDEQFLSKIEGDTAVLVDAPNSIILRYSGKNGACSEVEDSVKISVVQKVTIKADAVPQTIVKGAKTELRATIKGIHDSLLWTPDARLSCVDCVESDAYPEQSTYFKAAIVYSLNGYKCYNEDSVLVTVTDSCTRKNVTMPNAFVPSLPSSGKFNHIFYVKGYFLTDVKIFRVFDRWGNLIFERTNVPANDPQYGWNGKRQDGQDVEAGVYIYQVSVNCINGNLINLNSDVTLIR
jgi:PKD repeat protein